MTQEEKELLLRDLCARLPYGVKLRYVEDLVVKKESHIITLNNIYLEHILNGDADIKPYLRPMSSMIEEERKEYYETMDEYTHRLYPNSCDWSEHTEYSWTIGTFDWLNAHHFNYRGLIEKGLALEAPEGMYNIKTE